jgi:nucleotide-binding universal stress UspA family protein
VDEGCVKILFAHDGTAASDAAIDDMRRAGFPAEGEAFVVCTAGADLGNPSDRARKHDSMDAGNNELAEAKRLAEVAGNRIQAYFPKWNLSSDAFSGVSADVILKTSIWWQSDMLIIGSDTFAIDRLRMSGVSLEVVHRAQCSVRIVRFGVAGTSGRIQLVIGNSGSGECKAVVHNVAQRRWPENTQAHIVSVADTTFPQEKRNRAMAIDGEWVNRLEDAGLTVDQTLIEGDPHQELLRESMRWKADTIFVGPRRIRGDGRFLLGSVATAVVTRARSTVEVVRGS